MSDKVVLINEIPAVRSGVLQVLIRMQSLSPDSDHSRGYQLDNVQLNYLGIELIRDHLC